MAIPAAPFDFPGLRFEPQPGDLTGAAFGPVFKSIALFTVAGCCGWLTLLSVRDQIVIGGSTTSWIFLAGGLGIMLYTLWHIWFSQTRLSTDFLSQTWMWHRQVKVRELAYAKLIRIRGREWLIAPRLYTRSITGKLTVFYMADPTLWRESERLATALTDLRKPT
jgi:hypothetical protein